MTCSQCQGIERFFGGSTARRELRRYRRRGPSGTTRTLLESLRRCVSHPRTFLDVGGGVGVIQHELMDAGASGGTHVDASPAYLDAARAEARRRGHERRVRFVGGDVVELADGLPTADVVTLDRVVCCYPDMPAMVDATAPLAERAYGLVLPRITLLTRIGGRLVNGWFGLIRHPFRMFLHDPSAVAERVAGHGLTRAEQTDSILWRTVVFTRVDHQGVAGEGARPLSPPDRTSPTISGP